MPSFLPKQIHTARIFPEHVDLDELCSEERYRSSLQRAVKYLSSIYKNYSEQKCNPGEISEQFCFAMPTEDAYLAQIELVNAIRDHALGNINDESIKVSLKKYLDSHTFVYREVNRSWSQEFKTGYSRRTDSSVALFYVENYPKHSGHVLNPIASKLFLLIQEISGNAQLSYRVRPI